MMTEAGFCQLEQKLVFTRDWCKLKANEDAVRSKVGRSAELGLQMLTVLASKWSSSWTKREQADAPLTGGSGQPVALPVPALPAIMDGPKSPNVTAGGKPECPRLCLDYNDPELGSMDFGEFFTRDGADLEFEIRRAMEQEEFQAYMQSIAQDVDDDFKLLALNVSQ